MGWGWLCGPHVWGTWVVPVDGVGLVMWVCQGCTVLGCGICRWGGYVGVARVLGWVGYVGVAKVLG